MARVDAVSLKALTTQAEMHAVVLAVEHIRVSAVICCNLIDASEAYFRGAANT